MTYFVIRNGVGGLEIEEWYSPEDVRSELEGQRESIVIERDVPRIDYGAFPDAHGERERVLVVKGEIVNPFEE